MKTLRYLAAAAAVLALFACKKNSETPDSQNGDSINVTPSTVTIPGEGGSAKLAVETSAETVTCDVADSWLTAKVEGKEITLTAEANPDTKSARSTTVVVKAGKAESSVSVTQAKGSANPGYSDLQPGSAYYSGIMMMKMLGVKDYDGGQMQLVFPSEDGRHSLVLEFYTDVFESPEDVVLTSGTYTKGEDDFSASKVIGKRLTWIPGKAVVLNDGDEPEELQFGSCLYTTIGEEDSVNQISDGTFTISESKGIYTIKTDLKTEDGEDVKFYYEGAVTIDASYATYPGANANPTDVVAAEGSYMGESVNGATRLLISLFCDGGFPVSVFSIYIEQTSEEDIDSKDLSGVYSSEVSPGTSGSADLGAMMDYGDFQFPMGSYITYSLMDYFIPDELVSLTLVRQTDGKYIVTGTMRNSSGEEINFMDDRSSFEISFSGDEDYDD